MSTQPQAPLELHEFRAAARDLLVQRRAANEAHEQAVRKSAEAEGNYQRIKSTRYISIKHTGGSDGKAVAAAEAGERIKGDGEVVEALIARDLARELLRVRREDIAGIDEALAVLRRIGAWSQSLMERGVE